MVARKPRIPPKRTWLVRPRPLTVWAPRAEPDASLLPTFGVFCLLTFCFVSFSEKLPLGTVAAAGAIIAAAMRGRQFAIPTYYWWYLGYVAIGSIGLATTRYPHTASAELIETVKIALIGMAACNIVYTPRSARTFAVWYLALFALYPVRGALFNYIHGYTEFGRVAWNFFFSNPNDLAMACFLPLGLCAYIIFVEKNKWIWWPAWVGVVVITGVQMLTQSRGAILALAAGIAYFAFHTKRKVRTLLVIAVLFTVAVAATPTRVWHRVAGLSHLTSGDMHKVDPEGSAAGRSTLMRLAWETALSHPLLGIGIGAYALENARIAQYDLQIGRDERGERDAHSTYIRAAAETGFVGGLCVLLTVVMSIVFCRTKRKQVQQQESEARWAMALLALEASMVAYALGATVNSAERSTFFALQFVIPCALASVVASTKRRIESPPVARKRSRHRKRSTATDHQQGP